ncbi:hypothetical protein [Anaeromyxobacter terrae]|uniref:hypothetical protein n=1 Tax=Anaeromyxobacter terrae TaxID=2925406 RepID=UPI001F567BA8|nr:hypothetical protein [Anaeromyxobacter sp. SG22]
MNRTFAALVPVLALTAACGPDFDPASEVQGLRVLAIRAEPPEIAPASDGSAPARAELETLVVDPALVADPARRAVVLHVACTPAPGDPGPSPCTKLSELSNPAALLAGADLAAACAAPGVGAAGGISFAGLEACGRDGCGPVAVRRDPADPGSAVSLPRAAYALPADYTLSALPASSPERVLGLEVTDLALALDATPDELAPASAVGSDCELLGAVAARFEAEWSRRAHVAALKRIRVRGPAAPSAPNHNPVLSAVGLDGVALPAPGEPPAAVAPSVKIQLLPLLPGSFEELRETYVECDAAGQPIATRQEDWTFSWFTTAGELEKLHTNQPAEAAELTTPVAGAPTVWVVARDLIGGVAWRAGSLAVSP